jgi:hypothetical protein
MSIAAYLASGRETPDLKKALEAGKATDKKQAGADVQTTQPSYQIPNEYDAVLRAHCRL